MERIISDTYVKGKKYIFGDDPNTEFNKKIVAVNNMYSWLYEQGILEKAAFVYKDYSDVTYFAVDAKDLEPYRKEMEASNIDGAALAVPHIFDVYYTPCEYSGAIQLGWMMKTYRSVDGCVGSSWECDLIKNLNVDGIYKIYDIQREKGTKEAVKALFDEFNWEKDENEIRAVKLKAREIKLSKDFDYECNLSKEEVMSCDSLDKWGSAFVWVEGEQRYGAEYNFCDDNSGNNSSAIYKMTYNNETENWDTDYNTFVHYEIDFSDPYWRYRLEDAMCEALVELHQLQDFTFPQKNNRLGDILDSGLVMLIANHNDGEKEQNYLFTAEEFKNRFPELYEIVVEEPEEFHDDVVFKTSVLAKKAEDVFDVYAFLNGEFNDHNTKEHNNEWCWENCLTDFPGTPAKLPFSCVIEQSLKELSLPVPEVKNASLETVIQYAKDVVSKTKSSKNINPKDLSKDDVPF